LFAKHGGRHQEIEMDWFGVFFYVLKVGACLAAMGFVVKIASIRR
jgi:hypothetical protein